MNARRVLAPVVLLVLVVLIIAIVTPKYKAWKESQQPVEATPHVEVFAKMGYTEAKGAAARQGKLLLVDATATWCGPCQLMEETTWVDPQVIEWINERALAVQLDVDQDVAGAKELAIRAMPTVILMKDGREIARSVGYLDGPQLRQWLDKAAG